MSNRSSSRHSRRASWSQSILQNPLGHKTNPFYLHWQLGKQEDKQCYSGPAVILSLAHSTKDILVSSSSCQLAHSSSRCGPSLTSGLELNSLSRCSPNLAVAGRKGLGNCGKKREIQRKSKSHCSLWNETNVFFWKRPINLLNMRSLAEVIIVVLRDTFRLI